MTCGRGREFDERASEKAQQQELRRKEVLQQAEQLENFSKRMIAALHQLPVTDKLRDYISFGREFRGDEIAN